MGEIVEIAVVVAAVVDDDDVTAAATRSYSNFLVDLVVVASSTVWYLGLRLPISSLLLVLFCC